jgi:hypothetical protein
MTFFYPYSCSHRLEAALGWDGGPGGPAPRPWRVRLSSGKTKLTAPAYEGVRPPEPLTVEIQIRLSQCRSAEEALGMLAV